MIRLSSCSDSNDYELALLVFFEVWYSELSARMQLVGGINSSPIRSTFLVDLDYVALDRTSSIPLWWVPSKFDTGLGFVLYLWARRWARGV